MYYHIDCDDDHFYVKYMIQILRHQITAIFSCFSRSKYNPFLCLQIDTFNTLQ